MSKHSVSGGDIIALLARFAQLQEKAQVRTGKRFLMIVIQKAGLDGSWLHRLLEKEGFQSHSEPWSNVTVCVALIGSRSSSVLIAGITVLVFLSGCFMTGANRVYRSTVVVTCVVAKLGRNWTVTTSQLPKQER